jgi:hypothetical protein
MKIRITRHRQGKSDQDRQDGQGGIIQAIQHDEGNFPCFGTAVDGCCDQWECAWREGCLPKPAAHRP